MLKMKDEILREMNHPSLMVLEKTNAMIIDGVVIKNRYHTIEGLKFEVLLLSTLEGVSSDYGRMCDFTRDYLHKNVILVNDL